MNADPDPQHYLKRRDQRTFNLRHWRTSVYSTAYYIFFCSSAAGWHVREVDPPYLGKGFDIGIRYLKRNLHATYALFILTEFLQKNQAY
jgi:hypothetical protein